MHGLPIDIALLLGEWQMYIRSPLRDWIGNPELYYRSVTAHGSAMGYVFPTLVAMGFGYAIVELALKQPLVGRRWAWTGFILVLLGTVVAMAPVSVGLASVLREMRVAIELHRACDPVDAVVQGHRLASLVDLGHARHGRQDDRCY